MKTSSINPKASHFEVEVVVKFDYHDYFTVSTPSSIFAFQICGPVW